MSIFQSLFYVLADVYLLIKLVRAFKGEVKKL